MLRTITNSITSAAKYLWTMFTSGYRWAIQYLQNLWTILAVAMYAFQLYMFTNYPRIYAVISKGAHWARYIAKHVAGNSRIINGITIGGSLAAAGLATLSLWGTGVGIIVSALVFGMVAGYYAVLLGASVYGIATIWYAAAYWTSPSMPN